MNRTKQKRRQTSSEPTSTSAIFSSLFGLLVAAVTLISLTLAFSLVSLLCHDPRIVSRVLGCVSMYIVSFIGGFATYKRCGGYPILCGISFGLLYALIIWLCSLLSVNPDIMRPMFVWMMRAASVAVSVAGAFLGSYKPKRRHSPKRRR